MEIRKLLPPSIVANAYVFNSEYAWRLEDILAIADTLKKNRIAVLGGELWQKSDSGPIITNDMYQWSAKQKGIDETWDQFVMRTTDEMKDFSKNLEKESDLQHELYINLVTKDKNET